MKLLGSLSLILMIFLPLAYAERMDLETHNILIEKLESALNGQSYNQQQSISLRLADIYADRGRLKFINEGDQNCNNCLKSESDREKALKIYLVIFDSLGLKDQIRVLDQISHISQLVQSDKKADRLFDRIIQRKYHRHLKARAWLARANKNYFSGQFKIALTQYQKSLKLDPKLSSLSLDYQISWCYFNTNKAKKAEALLEKSLQQSQIKETLRDQMSRDLALFYSRRVTRTSDLKRLKSLSSQDGALGNLLFLSEEQTRYNHFDSALLALTFVERENALTPLQLAKIQLSKTKIYYAKNKKTTSLKYFAESIQNYKKVSCKKENDFCEEMQKSYRFFLVTWNNEEIRSPSSSLVKAYEIYLSEFDQDPEVFYWAAQVAERQKKWKPAYHFFNQTVELTYKETQYQKTLLQGSLIGAIRVAETWNRSDEKRQAYKNYLKYQPEGDKKIEVLYKLAYLDYENKNYSLALSQFLVLSQTSLKSTKTSDQAIIKKSCDLTLDIYALKKDNDAIINWSQYYAQKWPKQKEEYLYTYRRAVVSKAVEAYNSESDYRSKDLAEAYAGLRSLSFKNVEDKEKIEILKTQVKLAKKRRDLSEVKRCGFSLLRIKKLSQADQLWTQNHVIWAAEVQMDFKTAYLMTKKLDESSASKSLKLAFLSELSGRNPNSHYKDYIQKTKSVYKSNQARAKMIVSSSRPWKTIQKEMNQLKRTPVLFSELVLEVFSKNKNQRRAQQVIETAKLQRHPSGAVVYRHIEIPKIIKNFKKIQNQKITSKNENLMQRGITNRIQELTRMESVVNEAIRSQDWTLQVIALSLLKKENDRFVNEVLDLPVPSHLKGNDKKEYQKMVKKSLQRYVTRSQQIERKLSVFWKNTNTLQQLKNIYSAGQSSVQKLVAFEAQALYQYTSMTNKSYLKDLLKVDPFSKRQLLALRKSLYNDPFDKDRILELKEMEQRGGQHSMVAYLDQRLVNLDKEKR